MAPRNTPVRPPPASRCMIRSDINIRSRTLELSISLDSGRGRTC
jgi:hypothetical protein